MDQGFGESEPRVNGLYKTHHLVTDIKRIRLEWLGHVIRMNHTKEANKCFESKPEGRRKVGRHTLRWLEDVENALREKKVNR
jgi:hypothetical protein